MRGSRPLARGPCRSRTRAGGSRPTTPPHLFRKRAGLAGDTGLGLAISKELVEAHGGRIRAEQPSLVLLDLMLPGADGIELMGRVLTLAELPVIFISGYGRDQTIARALEGGTTDYIVKPFSATELVARVQAALRRRGAPETFALRDPKTPPASPRS